ncbi:MAG: hypothetical protein ACI4UH_07190 [Dorea sp.]
MKKRKITSLVFFILNLSLFFIPWITIGEESYNVLQYAVLNSIHGLNPFLELAQIPLDEAGALGVGTSVEMVLIFLELFFFTVYIVTKFSNKKWPVNLVVVILGVLIYYWHHMFSDVTGSLRNLCGESIISYVCTLLFIVIPVAEYFTDMVMGRWKETVEDYRTYVSGEQAWKKEVKERLAFAGQYDKPFYRIIWKNFKSNWKDYILLLGCSSLIFGFVIVGYGIQKIMSLEHTMENVQLTSELSTILINAMVPLAIISVFIIIMLLFYYLKCRAKNYGVFLTLGMRRKALYYFAGLEFVSVFLISVIVGGILGSFVLFVFTHYSETLLGMAVEFSVIGIKTYLKAIITVILVFGVSAMLARDVFVDFNVGKSTDLRAIGEPLPMKWRKGLLAAGVVICGVCAWQYGKISNFEKVYLLIGFFAGLYLIIRYGISEYLVKSRRNKKYLRKMVTESNLFHKSKTSSNYIYVLALMQFCVLFYFSFQMISPAITEDEDTLFPYDYMCIAYDEDEEFFADLKEDYDIELDTYPMVRVCNYDSSEEWEARGETPIQGQHIGISESTYHALKKQLDPSYEEMDLGLDAEGKKIYIVHQQDKSIKAQPVDFYSTAKRPLLIVSKPVLGYVDVYRTSRGHGDMAYQYRDIVGEEIGSLTGVFRQGLRENIIVFSDEYFAKAQTLWENIDIYSGLFMEGEYFELFYKETAMTQEGPSKLILIHAKEEELDAIDARLQEFEEKYVADRKYDASVSCYYAKREASWNLQSEHYMKMVMNGLLIVIFFVMDIVLVAIKMLTELDVNRRRAEFLTCMGMRKKDRNNLVMKEILYFNHLIPMIIAVVCAFLFTMVVFHVRIYSVADMQNYIGYMIPLWSAYFIGSTIVLWILTLIYARAVEGKKDARRS